MKLNCWEFNNCGREPGGPKAREFGHCPVVSYSALHGIHGGKNGGRACWVVKGSLCGGSVQGDEDQKRSSCWACDFLNLVKREEDASAMGFSHTRLAMDCVFKKTAAL